MNARGFFVPALIGIIIAILVVGAALYGTRQEQGGAPTPPPITDFTGTAPGLLQAGQNLTCAVSGSVSAGSVTGTAYVAGKGRRLRGDFTLARPDGARANGHVILAGGHSYFWSDELTQGTKISLAAPASPNGNEQNAFDQSLSYTCQPWSIQADVFALPIDKEFVELTQP